MVMQIEIWDNCPWCNKSFELSTAQKNNKKRRSNLCKKTSRTNSRRMSK
jgi:hypothetical protein